MKNKKFIIGLILILLPATGCSGSTPSSNTIQPGSSLSQSANTAQGQQIEGIPDRVQDFFGKVEDIKGNMAVMIELKMPEGALAQAGGQNVSPDASVRRDELSKMTEEERQKFIQEMRAQREAQGQTQGQGQGQQGQAAGASGRQGNAAARQFKYEETENNYKVMIPVGTPLIKRSVGTGGQQQTSMQISEIKEGDVFRIWVEKLEAEGESRVIYAELLAQSK